jgi:hypothetical protein
VLLPLLFIANILYRGYVGCLAESDPDDRSLTDDEKYHLYGR